MHPNLHGLIHIVYVAISMMTLNSVADDEVEQRAVGGIVDKSVRLNCDLPLSTNPEVEWIDFVYNMDRNGKRIFVSRDNDRFEIDPDHENKHNFAIGSDYSLTISSLKVGQDPGNYVCTSKVDGVTHQRSYFLTVGDMPKCSGETNVREGSTTTLTCQSEYSGADVTLVWERNSQVLPSDDSFDVRLARRTLTLSPTYADDQQIYVCRMTIGNVAEECTMKLDVAHLTRDLILTPSKDTYRVGEEIRCAASGNPTPAINMDPFPERYHTGRGWLSTVLDRSWIGTRSIVCSASNTLDGQTEIINRNFTLTVLEEREEVGERGSIASEERNYIIIIGVIATAILILIAIVVLVIIYRKKSPKKPKAENIEGAKPLPSKEEINQSQYGQAV